MLKTKLRYIKLYLYIFTIYVYIFQTMGIEIKFHHTFYKKSKSRLTYICISKIQMQLQQDVNKISVDIFGIYKGLISHQDIQLTVNKF